MFDLDTAIHQWSRDVCKGLRWNRTRRLEFEDHLHCEIERLVASGESLPEAFELAKARFGGDHLASLYANSHHHSRGRTVGIALVVIAACCVLEYLPILSWIDGLTNAVVALLMVQL